MGLYDNNLNVVVEYAYDSWGNTVSITGSLASTLGQDNPFRYRGYYFDSDTGLYYLNSRYYDANTGRFVNADGFVQTGQGLLDKNMLAYCANNPILYQDPSGQSYVVTIPAEGNSGRFELMQSLDDHNNYNVAFNNGTYTVVSGNVIDITDKLNTEMKKNSTTFSDYSKNNNMAKTTMYFIEQVKPGGEWDFKSQDSWNLKPDQIYRYENQFLRYDDIGNIHYGYVGSAVYGKEILLIAGGCVQIYTRTSKLEYIQSNFDDPRDQEMIAYGCMLWDSGALK